MPKKSENSSRRLPQELRSLGYHDFLAPNISSGYEPPQPPKFPKFFDLVQSEIKEQDAPKNENERRLFSALIGDARILYQELLEDPGRFDEKASALIQNLSCGAQQLSNLTPEELDLLDNATLDFARPRRLQPSSKTTAVTSPRRSTAVKHLTKQEALSDPSVPLVHQDGGAPTLLSEETSSLPAERPATFWWKK